MPDGSPDAPPGGPPIDPGPARPAGAAPAGVPTARLVLGVVVLPGLLAAVALGAAPLVASRLPDPMAVHWGADGTPNGTMTLTQNEVFLALLLLMLWGIGAFGVVVGRRTPIRFRTERMAMLWCCSVTAFVAVLGVGITLANLDAATWHDTRFGVWAIVPALLAAALAGWIGYVLAGPAPAPTPLAADGPGEGAVAASDLLELPVVTLGPHEDPAWADHLTSRSLLALAIGLAAMALVLLATVPIAGVAVLVGALACGALSSVGVVVDRTGLTVRFGPFGWPSRRFPLADLRHVDARAIEPLEWGGWGYRVLPGRSAVVLRRGPAIVVERADGRRFAVTVDDAVTGAALLDAYRRRDAGRA